jgi:membrane protein implicated in regulation of membrane protease activity
MNGTAGVVLQLGGLLELGLPALLLLAGLALVVMEALAPGAHLIVVGVALLVVGIIGLGAASLGGPVAILAAPLALAFLTVIVGAITFFAYREFDLYGGESTATTSDSESLKGKTGRVTERVTETGGEVKLESGGFNPYYQARSMDGEIAEGTKVSVVDPGGGNVLTVMPIEATRDPIDRELERDRASKGEPAGAEADTEPATERETERR